MSARQGSDNSNTEAAEGGATGGGEGLTFAPFSPDPAGSGARIGTKGSPFTTPSPRTVPKVHVSGERTGRDEYETDAAASAADGAYPSSSFTTPNQPPGYRAGATTPVVLTTAGRWMIPLPLGSPGLLDLIKSYGFTRDTEEVHAKTKETGVRGRLSSEGRSKRKNLDEALKKVRRRSNSVGDIDIEDDRKYDRPPLSRTLSTDRILESASEAQTFREADGRNSVAKEQVEKFKKSHKPTIGIIGLDANTTSKLMMRMTEEGNKIGGENYGLEGDQEHPNRVCVAASHSTHKIDNLMTDASICDDFGCDILVISAQVEEGVIQNIQKKYPEMTIIYSLEDRGTREEDILRALSRKTIKTAINFAKSKIRNLDMGSYNIDQKGGEVPEKVITNIQANCAKFKANISRNGEAYKARFADGVGILGGAGPGATGSATFEAVTRGKNCLTIDLAVAPWKQRYFEGRGPNWQPFYTEYLKIFADVPVPKVFMPCNTVHDALSSFVPKEISHKIIDFREEVFKMMTERATAVRDGGPKLVILLGTDTTTGIASSSSGKENRKDGGLYEKYLQDRDPSNRNNIRIIKPTPEEQRLVMDLIYEIKKGHIFVTFEPDDKGNSYKVPTVKLLDLIITHIKTRILNEELSHLESPTESDERALRNEINKVVTLLGCTELPIPNHGRSMLSHGNITTDSTSLAVDALSSGREIISSPTSPIMSVQPTEVMSDDEEDNQESDLPVKEKTLPELLAELSEDAVITIYLDIDHPSDIIQKPLTKFDIVRGNIRILFKRKETSAIDEESLVSKIRDIKNKLLLHSPSPVTFKDLEREILFNTQTGEYKISLHIGDISKDNGFMRWLKSRWEEDLSARYTKDTDPDKFEGTPTEFMALVHNHPHREYQVMMESEKAKTKPQDWESRSLEVFKDKSGITKEDIERLTQEWIESNICGLPFLKLTNKSGSQAINFVFQSGPKDNFVSTTVPTFFLSGSSPYETSRKEQEEIDFELALKMSLNELRERKGKVEAAAAEPGSQEERGGAAAAPTEGDEAQAQAAATATPSLPPAPPTSPKLPKATRTTGKQTSTTTAL